MNNCVFTMAIMLYCQSPVSAMVINGFLLEKLKLETEIRNFLKLSKEVDSYPFSKELDKEIRILNKKYTIACKMYFDTEQLISEIKSIDPELFEKVSIVANSEGTLTHVYVRYVDRTSKQFIHLKENYFNDFGYTSVGQWKKNENVCESFYGTNTICVTIVKGSYPSKVLAHEFGHVLYIVPKLKSYINFFNNHSGYINNKYSKGHSPYDPSYKFVKSIERSFLIKYINYLKDLKTMKRRS